ncbi:hypothetical protein WMY93_008377 [Mugilogobius chulae]|uniref:Uncharacterized protein n=1 Tax=Mugilogobius chulae TaxID=88201 RepID=A0AAW0PKQ2_9GOBI
MLRKSGSSGDEKDKFPLYDQLDAILGTRPTSSPQYIVESYQEETPATPASLTMSESDSTELEQESVEADKSSTDLEVEETPTTSSLLEGERGEPKGTQKRKKKTKTDRFEKMFESYLDEKKKMDEDECKRMKQESTCFENFLKMQQQAEEKRFQLLQEQQRANNQMFFQMMGTFLRAAVPQPMTPPPMTQQWMPPTPVRPPVWPTPSSLQTSAHTQHTDNSSSFITHQHNIPSTHHTVPAPPQTPPEPYMTNMSQHSTSSVLTDVNRDFFEL